MARTVEINEDDRRLLLRLVGEEWKRLDEIRNYRFIFDDPILKEQQDIDLLLEKLR